MLTLIIIVLVLAAAGGIAYALLEQRPNYGRYYGLAKLTGARTDIGPVNWSTLARHATPNDALVCPAGHCPRAEPDREPKIYSEEAGKLLARLKAVALAEPDTIEVAGLRNERRAHFIQHTRLMRFPDTIDIEVLPVGDNASTLAIYSRSLIGRKDFGVNRARVERWLAALG